MDTVQTYTGNARYSATRFYFDAYAMGVFTSPRLLPAVAATALLVLLPSSAGQSSGTPQSTAHFRADTCTGRWMSMTARATAIMHPATVPSLFSLASVRSQDEARSFVQHLLAAPLRSSWASMQLQSKNAVIRDNKPVLEIIEELSVTLSPSVRSVAGLVPSTGSPAAEYSLSAVNGRQPVLVRCVYKPVNMFYPTLLAVAFLMWFYAPSLAHSALFYYTSGELPHATSAQRTSSTCFHRHDPGGHVVRGFRNRRFVPQPPLSSGVGRHVCRGRRQHPANRFRHGELPVDGPCHPCAQQTPLSSSRKAQRRPYWVF